MRRERLRQRIKERGYTQRSLAEEIGLNPTTISRIINGQSDSYPWVLSRIGAALECSTQEILDARPLSPVDGYAAALLKVTTLRTAVEDLVNQCEETLKALEAGRK